MAVIQISKIQIRRGTTLEEGGMPQLASGELGWSVDEQKLYIGNGSVAEGAPAVGNTEILTQFSTATINLFNSIYSYSVTSAGTWTNYPVERPLQQRLEDRVSVKDFGATGDGVTDDTAAIQRAIKQLYVEETSSSYRKSLLFPAGIYSVTNVIYVPDNACLVGEGPSRSVLVNYNSTAALLQTRSTTGTNFLSLPATSNTVSNISISDLGFKYHAKANFNLSNTVELLVLDNTIKSTVDNCSFEGTWTVKTPVQSVNLHYSGIAVKGELSDDNTISRSSFRNLAIGVRMVQDITDCNVRNSNFFNLRRGVTIGDLSAGTIKGPRRSQITQNIFDRIQWEAIEVVRPITNTTTATSIISSENKFLDVGTLGRGENFQSHAVINFSSATNCVSVNDLFYRSELINTVFTGTAPKPLVLGPSVELVYPLTKKVLLESNTDQTLLRIPYDAKTNGLTVDYIMEKTSRVRKGTLTVNCGPTGVTYTDNYNYIGASTIESVELKAELKDYDISGQYDSIVIKYRNPTGYNTGTITTSIKSLS